MISPLTLEDCAEAARLHQAAFFRGWSQDSFQTTFQTSGTFGLQITDAGTLRGYLLWREVGEEAEILTIVVAAESQRKGHGRALFQAFEKILRQRNVRVLFIEVAEDNEGALYFYGCHGFLPLGRRLNYYPRDNNNSVSALTFFKKIV